MSLFIDPAELDLVPLLFLFCVYAYILFNASNYISDGSELLLLVPAYAGVVGSVVLPVLGAVPDGAIVLFSGMGPQAQENLTVGVGALAGSTIMLLTIPWALAVIFGRVNIENGLPNYKGKPKLRPAGNASLFGTGVLVQHPVRNSAYLMLGTALSYLLIQGPAFIYQNEDDDKIKKGEHTWSFLGFLVSSFFFVMYLYYQMKVADEDQTKEDKINAIAAEQINSGEVTLLAVIQPQIDHLRKGRPIVSRRNSLTNAHKNESSQSLLKGQHYQEPNSYTSDNNAQNTSVPIEIKDKIHDITKHFFRKYDADQSGSIEVHELTLVMSDLGFSFDDLEIQQTLTKYDKDGNKKLCFDEFCDLIVDKIQHIAEHGSEEKIVAKVNDVENGGIVINDSNNENADEEDEDEEEEEEVPDDLKHLSYEQQQFRLKLRALYMMSLGTALVLLFSDPMVDVLSAMGNKFNINSFYIAFVLCPLASNASELIAAANYASKKTSKSIDISLSALTGAACMNNTFCLAIFLILIYAQKLEWEFSAETISILVVELILGVYCFKKVHTLFDGFMILAIYPLSICLVYVLENVFHMN